MLVSAKKRINLGKKTVTRRGRNSFRKGLSDKANLCRDLKEGSKSSKYVQKDIPSVGNSQCKSPEEVSCSLCL